MRVHDIFYPHVWALMLYFPHSDESRRLTLNRAVQGTYLGIEIK